MQQVYSTTATRTTMKTWRISWCRATSGYAHTKTLWWSLSEVWQVWPQGTWMQDTWNWVRSSQSWKQPTMETPKYSEQQNHLTPIHALQPRVGISLSFGVTKRSTNPWLQAGPWVMWFGPEAVAICPFWVTHVIGTVLLLILGYCKLVWSVSSFGLDDLLNPSRHALNQSLTLPNLNLVPLFLNSLPKIQYPLGWLRICC